VLWCFSCLGASLAFIAVCLFAASFSSVGPLEYGLHFSNWNNKMVTNDDGTLDVYTGGRYFIGLGHTFIAFPTNCVTIDFATDPMAKNAPLATRTKDGLPVTIEIALQYKLKPEALLQLYTELNVGYEAAFVRNARDALLEEAGDHLATEYWEHRKTIGELMLERLSTAPGLEEFAEIRGVQILTVILPSAYEMSIMQTQVSVQEQKKAAFEQAVERVNSETAQLVNTVSQCGTACGWNSSH
jgi:regulator of protease activity HflC (stomatin/prohibitin superfamily)